MTLVFLTAGYFQNSRPGWNVNSQFALTAAIAERATLRIDAYHDKLHFETGDKAFFEGHYYCDKSPVTAFLGVPVYFLYRQVTRLFDLPFSYEDARYWTTWWTAGLGAAILAGLLAALLMRRGVAAVPAARGAALWLAATPLLGYAILFFNILPACGLALGGFMLIEPVARAPFAVSRRRLALGGLLLGLAAWTLNTMAIVALGLTVWLAAAPMAGGGRGERLRGAWRRLWPWALGGLAGIAGYFIYIYALFGSLGSPYAYEADPFFRTRMAQGLMGATIPRPLVAWLITFHPFQGLFLWFPLTALALAGCVWNLVSRERGSSRESGLALAIAGAFVLYTSAYFMWWGGWAYAPRHLLPMLALLGVGLAPWLRARWSRRVVFLVGLAGAVFNFAAVALDPQPPPGLPQEALLQPQLVAHWPSPFLMIQKYFWMGGSTDRNWGTALGLHGPWCLLPLGLLWVLAWWWLGRCQDPRTVGESRL